MKYGVLARTVAQKRHGLRWCYAGFVRLYDRHATCTGCTWTAGAVYRKPATGAENDNSREITKNDDHDDDGGHHDDAGYSLARQRGTNR
jgi:hypothetical protein